MRPASFATTVGSAGAPRESRDVVVVHEPEIGSTLRTRGRFYLVCEIDPPSRAGSEIATEVAELARQDYYYDLSAGVAVGLRRAIRKANRRAAQLLREQRGRTAIHLACAVIVNNELHAARVGSAHVFLVRHARLFLPGDEPDELADFVHRTTTRQAASLGAETDLLPLVWDQSIEAGDTVILATGSVVDALGAEALKHAAITLHPVAAARHVRDRSIAEGVSGSHASIFIEVRPASGAAARLEGEPEIRREAAEVVIAEGIRARVDGLSRLIPRPGRMAAAISRPVAGLMAGAVGVVLELMPRRKPDLPRRADGTRRRSARVGRLTTLLALLLFVATLGVGGAVLRDYEANQIVNEYRLSIVAVEQDIASTRSFAARKDETRAWERLAAASERLRSAERSPVKDPVRVAQLREEIGALEDKLNGVIIDLSKIVPGAAPASLAQTVNGLYAADPGAGRLWRIFGDPPTTGVVLQRGANKMGSPVAVTAVAEALLTLDDARTLWRAEGNTIKEVTLAKTDTWKSVTGLATFAGNIYVLDAASGQLWRYEPDFAGDLGDPIPFLPQTLPPGSATGLAVDGDIWVLTAAGELQRYRRQGFDRVLTRLPFTPQWNGAALRPTFIQALESQRSIWLLDGQAKVVAQMTRDGRELARFPIPERLPAPTAFFVSEGQRLAYTVHGSKIATTDLTR